MSSRLQNANFYDISESEATSSGDWFFNCYQLVINGFWFFGNVLLFIRELWNEYLSYFWIDFSSQMAPQFWWVYYDKMGGVIDCRINWTSILLPMVKSSKFPMRSFFRMWILFCLQQQSALQSWEICWQL